MHIWSIISIVLLGFTLCPNTTWGAFLRGYFPRSAYGHSSSKAPTIRDVLFKSNPGNWLREYMQRQGFADEKIDCMAANQYYKALTELGIPSILTERGNGVCPTQLGSTYYLEECDSYDCKYMCGAQLYVSLLAETIREDECRVLEVFIGIYNGRGEVSGCYLALLNGVQQVSCPPDELPEKYRILYLHPVYWEDAPKYEGATGLGMAGYVICAERTTEPCHRQARMLTTSWKNFPMSTHIVPIVY